MHAEWPVLFARFVNDHCKGSIAYYKVPRYIKFVHEFPMTVTGKIQKFEMRNAMTRELNLGLQKSA